MAVRAKFTVSSITQTHYGQPQARTVKLTPEYDTSIPEDQRFSDATPSGEFTMYINNPRALEELALGKKFYIDLTEAP